MSIQALRERKTEIARAANELLVNNGDKVWSEDDRAKYKDMMTQLERINDQIKAYQDQLDADADAMLDDAARPGARRPSNAAAAQVRDALAIYLRTNPVDLTPDDAAVIRNAMSTTTPSEGGYTVSSTVAPEIIETRKEFGGLYEICHVLPMASGEPLNYPTTDGTGEVGEWVGENQPAGSGDIGFGTAPLPVFKSSSKKIAIPWELITDSGIDVIGLVVRRLMFRLLRTHNLAYTVGDGVGKPTGLVGRTSVGKLGAAGQVATVTYGDLVDTMHSVNSAYRKAGRWDMADSSVRVIRKLVDGNGRPIFTPGYEYGITQDVPDLLLGKPITVNDDMPAMAAGAKSIIFGDHKAYTIREVNGVILRRFDDSAFALNGQVGFCAWQRVGGNLMDTAALKAYQNAAA